jgi:hypothetical protein
MSTPFACEEYRDLLIWYAAGQLSLRERETTAAHLANCAECREELGPWQAVAATFASEDAAGLVDLHADAEWERLLARLPDRGGRMPRSSGLPWRSSWTTLLHLRRTHATQLHTIEVGDPKRYAAAAGVDVSHPRRHSPAWLGLVASIVLVVALIATFALLRLGSTGASQPKLPIEQWVQLRGAPEPTGLPAGAVIAGLAMVSPSEGWAVGSTYAFGPNVVEANDTLTPRFTSGLILHYQNGHWSAEPDSPRDVALTNVFIISPGEGWAYGGLPSNGGTVFFHLQDNRWQRADFPLPRGVRPDAGSFGVGLLRIRTATDMWLVGSFAHPTPGKDEAILWHYDGQTWQSVQSPLSGVSDLVVTGPNEAYAVGISSAVAQSGTGASSPSMIVHLVGNVGTEVASSATNESLEKLYAISSSDVWATGETHLVGVPEGTPVPAASAEPKPVLYHFDGTRWASTPLATLHAPTGITQIAFTGQEAAWGFTTQTDRSRLDPYDSGVVRIATAYQYTGGQWQQSPWPFTSILTLSSITYTAQDDAWAIGTYDVTWVKMHADTTSTGVSFSGSVMLHFTHGHWMEYGQTA